MTRSRKGLMGTLLSSECLSTRIVIAFVVALTTPAYAQKDSLRSDFAGISYFSEGGFYPGFTLNIERSLLANKQFEIMAAARIGSYFHYRNHTGVFVTAQSGQRIRLYKSLYFEHYVGIGYLQRSKFPTDEDIFKLGDSECLQMIVERFTKTEQDCFQMKYRKS